MNLYGLIGFPLEHSFSEKYFQHKFEKESIHDSIFRLFPLTSIKLFPQLLTDHSNLIGLAVTIPYKESVIPYVTELVGAAQEIQAVNCITIKHNRRIGYNTDVIGFEKSLLPLLQSHHTHALILGTGGASKAVQYVLKKLGIHFICVSRNQVEMDQTIAYENINADLLKQCPLIINTTPLGMFPDISTCPPIPYQNVTTKHLLYDLVYTPSKTKFLQNGALHGARVKNGMEMLEIQAEENWKIWNH